MQYHLFVYYNNIFWTFWMVLINHKGSGPCMLKTKPFQLPPTKLIWITILINSHNMYH